MERNKIKRVLIAGGGTAGWIAAAVLARTFLPEDLAITLVESPEVGTVGVGEATIPPILSLNRLLGLDEDELVRRTGATFKLGIEFCDWGALGDRYFHPFGSFGAEINGLPFHLQWLRQRPAPYGDFSLPTIAARAGKFIRPAEDPRNVLSRVSYALHFDASLYAQLLAERACHAGVRHVQDRIVGVVRREDGFVEGVQLSGGQRLDADLFIDCSGFRGLLIEEAMSAGWEDWSHWLPVDRAWAVPTARSGPTPPLTRSTAGKAGWQWRIPLQHRTGNGHVFCSGFMGEDEARAELLAGLEGPPLAEPRLLRFTTGRRRKAWVKNVVALGLSAGFIEPLESTSIHLIQAGVTTLMSLFPGGEFAQAEIDTYNRLAEQDMRRVRDFVILHYKQTRRSDTPFWRHVAAMNVPDTLAERMALFASRGRLIIEPGELFVEASWTAVMLGQGLAPGACDPIAEVEDAAAVRAQMERMREVIRRGVEVMPQHEAFIAEHCRAEAALAPAGRA